MTQSFRSKIDAWLVIVFLSPLLLTALVPSSAAGSARLIVALTAVLILGLGAWFLLTTSYTIAPDELVVRCGPFTERVPLRAITAVRASRSLLSSPALSLDRLALSYGADRSILISPRDKLRFLAELGKAGVPIASAAAASAG